MNMCNCNQGRLACTCKPNLLIEQLQSDLTTADQLCDDLQSQLNECEGSRRSWFEAAQAAEKRVEDLAAAPVPPQGDALPFPGYPPVPEDRKFPQGDAQPVFYAQTDKVVNSEGWRGVIKAAPDIANGYVFPLYTHPDAGEVERLNGQLEVADQAIAYAAQQATDKQKVADALMADTKQFRGERDTLRAQLAERDGLLNRWLDVPRHLGQALGQLTYDTEAALSASAEPINDLCAEGVHEFVPLRSECVKCDALYNAEPSAFAERCDGKEQGAFEKWAESNKFDMSCHPLHWLFLDAKTYAARKGWAAGLEYATGVARAALDKSTEGASHE